MPTHRINHFAVQMTSTEERESAAQTSLARHFQCVPDNDQTKLYAHTPNQLNI